MACYVYYPILLCCLVSSGFFISSVIMILQGQKDLESCWKHAWSKDGQMGKFVGNNTICFNNLCSNKCILVEHLDDVFIGYDFQAYKNHYNYCVVIWKKKPCRNGNTMKYLGIVLAFFCGLGVLRSVADTFCEPNGDIYDEEHINKCPDRDHYINVCHYCDVGYDKCYKYCTKPSKTEAELEETANKLKKIIESVEKGENVSPIVIGEILNE